MANRSIYKVPLLYPDATEIEATIELDKDGYQIVLIAPGIHECVEHADDYFDAFAEIRGRLAKRDIYPICYGASRDVWPSGMCRDMGGGLKAYQFDASGNADMLVDIFATGPGINPVSPKEQREFMGKFLRHLPPLKEDA